MDVLLLRKILYTFYFSPEISKLLRRDVDIDVDVLKVVYNVCACAEVIDGDVELLSLCVDVRDDVEYGDRTIGKFVPAVSSFNPDPTCRVVGIQTTIPIRLGPVYSSRRQVFLDSRVY